MSPAALTSPGRSAGRPPQRRWAPAVPPQHGAWAFLAVPVLCGFAVAAATPAGWLLLAAWLAAYPLGYYVGRAVTARVRRGGWTRLARRELRRAGPWGALTAALGLPLAWTRPWLVAVAGAVAIMWAVGLWVAELWGERSMANDLVLVAQALAALPVTVAIAAGPAALTGDLALPTATCAAVLAAYLIGSVIHVKSLLREAGRIGYRRLDIGWHALAAGAAALAGPWWLVGLAPALARSVAMRPGLRPGVIGGVEAMVSVLVVVAAFLALPSG